MMDCETPPRFSIVIPVYNCGETIGRCIESLLRQETAAFEIIIVDDGSEDRTREICKSFTGVIVLSRERGGPSRGRNLGIGMARGEFVAFTDGDCIVGPRWLAELEKGFSGPEVAGVGGSQASPDDETATGRTIQGFLESVGFVSDYVKSHKAAGETAHNPTCNVMYRKSVLVEVGGFDETLWPGEDVDLDYRIAKAGYKLVYNPESVVRHYRPKTYRKFAGMMMRYGAAQRWLVGKHGFFRGVQFVPFAVGVLLAAVLGILFLWPAFLPILFLPALLPLLFFTIKTGGDFRRSVTYFLLLAVALGCWNWGFVTGAGRNRSNAGGRPLCPS